MDQGPEYDDGVMLRLATVTSRADDTRIAVDECLRALAMALGSAPHAVLCVTSTRHPLASVGSFIARFWPKTAVHGLTSCIGVTDAQGLAEGGLGMLAIADADGAYGSACLPFAGHPRHTAHLAALQAVRHAGRPGVPPAMILLASTPRYEEMVLAGIRDAVGADVPIIGGSAADDTIAGGWSVCAGIDDASEGCAVSAWYPSCRLAWRFNSLYEPTRRTGVVTGARGRLIETIDDQPAARWYDQAIGGLLTDRLAGGGTVLMDTTLHPLGRVACYIAGQPHYQLAHPERITADGGLTTFAEMMIGEEVTVMASSIDALVGSAGRVVTAALNHHDPTDDTALGAFFIYCAGCMLTVRGRMDEVAASVRRALHDAPFLVAHTFGEQGCFPDGANRHGNLMITTVVLRP